MALALSRARRLKPELQLTLAVKEFEAILDDDQKLRYDGFSKQMAPGVGAPLALTCMLDRNLNGKRCVGVRTLNILQSTQQFSTAIDIVVGGAQNIMISSIWGILKLSLIVSNSMLSIDCMH